MEKTNLEIEIIKGTIVKISGHPVRLKESLTITNGEPIKFEVDNHEVLAIHFEDDDGYIN